MYNTIGLLALVCRSKSWTMKIKDKMTITVPEIKSVDWH
jgi:hypothetical protein